MLLRPESHHGVGAEVGGLLLEFLYELLPHVAGQLGQALDLPASQALETRPAAVTLLDLIQGDTI